MHSPRLSGTAMAKEILLGGKEAWVQTSGRDVHSSQGKARVFALALFQKLQPQEKVSFLL